MYYIKTPATTANMGPGFDSIGMAFQIYNHLWVEEAKSGITIESKTDLHIPRDTRNLIYSSIIRFFDETGITNNLSGIKLIQEDYIPFTRGLGSSAACIVSGLMAANALTNSKLSKKELAQIAAKIEGHPDNSTPAILGGMTVGAMDNKDLTFLKIDMRPIVEKGLKFGIMIPNFQLSTKVAREVLPENYSRDDVVFNASRSALLVASMMNCDFENLAISVDDRIHQPYRKKIIPNMEDIFAFSKANNATGVFLSGAGPTLITLYQDNSFEEIIKEYLKTLPNEWTFNSIPPDFEGATVEEVRSVN